MHVVNEQTNYLWLLMSFIVATIPVLGVLIWKSTKQEYEEDQSEDESNAMQLLFKL